MTTKQFFDEYPDATGAWKVGNDFYFLEYQAPAQEHAARHGLKCELVLRAETSREDDGSEQEQSEQEQGGTEQKPTQNAGKPGKNNK